MSIDDASLDEKRRLEALREYGVLDTPPERGLDDLTTLAATICEAPIAVITLVDEHRQWFKSKTGLEAAETPREVSFCAHALRQTELLIVPDATLDERFAENPLVTGEPGIRFYAGAPLVTPDGDVLGALCVIDRVPRTLTPAQKHALRVLSGQVMTQFELRRRSAELQASERQIRAIIDTEPECVKLTGPDGTLKMMNPAGLKIVEATSFEEIAGRSVFPLVVPEHRAQFEALTGRVFGGESGTLEYQIIGLKGTRRWLETHATPLRDERGTVTALLGITRDISARKEAEEALVRSEKEQRELAVQLETERARLVAAQAVAKVGSWETDLSTMVVVWSAETFRIFETDPAQFQPTHQGFLQLVHPDDRAAVDKAFIESFDQSTAAAVEHRLLMADGRIKFIEEYWQIFDDERGKPVRALGTCRDITERKQAEAQLKLLETCVARLNDIVFITEAEPQDEPGPRIIFVNDAFVRLTGYTREEVLGRSPRFLQGPKTSRAELDRIHAAMRQWKPVRAELINYKKSGEEFWLELDIVPVADATGWITHWVAVERDITERKHTGERFRRLVDSNAQGVIFWKTTGEITGANDAFLRLVGYTREDLEAGRMNWVAMTPPEYTDRDRHCLEEIAAKGVSAPFEKEYIRKDGSRVALLLGAAAFEDNPEECVCFAVDLTERKKLEQQFLRAQRMESIGTLAGGIAHDLNNSLGPIIMSLDILKMKFTDPGSQDLLAIIGASAQRGADMVRQVLSFARGVEGRRMEVQIRHLIQDVEKIVNDTFLKNIQVRTIVPHDLWTVMGDPTQLHQVLINLCVNARDAMPNGGTLTISAGNVTFDAHYAGLNLDARPGPYVFIQVEDRGTGMTPEVMETIFDPFFTTKEVGKGTGLGLSTSLAIVTGHGGFMRVYSEVGKGTKFDVNLPAQTEILPAGLPELATRMPRGNGELILVVDDEATVRQITQQTLETFGYRVVLASEGAEAVAIFARQGTEIAAVLTDMMMPGMDGPATMQVLRKLNLKVPIIAASGLSTAGDAARLASLGIKHFLPKPFTAETLLKALKEVLSAEG